MATSNSISYKPVSNPKKALSSRALFGAFRCCPSTPGSWHRQSGPDSCLPITTASATSARATISPDYLLSQLVRVSRRGAWDLTGYRGTGGHSQDMRINSNTHEHVLCVAIESHVLAMACTSRVAGEVHDLYAPRARSRPRSGCHAFTRRQAVSGVALLATRYLGTMPGLG